MLIKKAWRSFIRFYAADSKVIKPAYQGAVRNRRGKRRRTSETLKLRREQDEGEGKQSNGLEKSTSK